MRKFLLLSSAAALCALSVTAQAAAPQFVTIGKKPVSAKLAQARASVTAAAQPQLWRAAKIAHYYWQINDYETNAGEWFISRTETCTYNRAGQVTSRSDENQKVVFEYDADGRCISETSSYFDGMGFTPSNKVEYTYDNVVKNLVTDEKFYSYQDGKWNLNEERRTVIIRNADNNITKIVEQGMYSYDETPGWQDQSLVEIDYGTDKKATSFKVYEYDNNEPSVQAELVDIVWERTDGQIVFFQFDEAEFFLGANLIKSAKGPKASNYPYAGDILYTVTYKANDGGYVMNATMNGTKYASQDYTVLDAYGSYTSEDFEIDYDSMDDGTYQPDGPQLDSYTRIYDAYGLELKNSETSYTDGDKANGISYQYEMTATVTYDPTHGYPLEYISRSTYDGQAPQYNERIVYSDYYDVIEAGVTDVEIDSNAPVEYYNLQGVRVENPTSGLYIRRRGNTATKVLIK